MNDEGGTGKIKGFVVEEEFEEGDVWGIVDTPSNSPNQKCKYEVNGARLGSHSKDVLKLKMNRSSSPLNIPKRANNSNVMKKLSATMKVPYVSSSHIDSNSSEEDTFVPPHEWLAKREAKSGISSLSVLEGVGRTLKGRDLIKVRKEVLTKTGFIE